MSIWCWIILSLIALIVLWAIYWRFFFFFRDPDRVTPEGNNIVAPADGQILYVKRVEKGIVPIAIKNRKEIKLEEIMKMEIQDQTSDKYIIGIFMGQLDVHVNRAPVSGTIAKMSYFSSRNYGMARIVLNRFFQKKPLYAGTKHIIVNERKTTLIQGDFPIYVVQIADLFVNKIVSWVSEGDLVRKGQRIGIIKMGSQVDVIFPFDLMSIKVKEGQKVRAGVTVLANWEGKQKEEIKEDSKEDELEIRPAKYSELEIIAQNNIGSNLSYEAFTKFLRCAYETEPQYVLVAVVDGKVVGHIIGSSKIERLYIKLLCKGDLPSIIRGVVDKPPLDIGLLFGAQIAHVNVYNEFTGRGLGTFLTRKMLETLRANAIHKCRLWTRKDNSAAVKCAMKIGANPRRKNRGWIGFQKM